jgi:hypothetical protein
MLNGQGKDEDLHLPFLEFPDIRDNLEITKGMP